jgi:Wadjet protein JetA
MTDWQSIVPRSAWSILGSGPSPELYPVYLDVLLALYGTTTRYTTGLGLPYEQARATADLVIEEHGIYQTLPEDEFYDPELESDLSISHGAKLLRRRERAGWLRREWDQIPGNNMVRFPAFAFVVLSSLAELQEVESVESDTVLVSILDILTDERVQKRQAIRQAHHLMARLIEAAQSTAHQLASWSPEVERLRPSDLSSWVAGYRGSQAEQEYLRFKLRHSPDRWHAEITASVNDLQENISRIVADSVGKGGVLTPHPTPDDVARTASEVACNVESDGSFQARLAQLFQDLGAKLAVKERSAAQGDQRLAPGALVALSIGLSDPQSQHRQCAARLLEGGQRLPLALDTAIIFHV